MLTTRPPPRPYNITKSTLSIVYLPFISINLKWSCYLLRKYGRSLWVTPIFCVGSEKSKCSTYTAQDRLWLYICIASMSAFYFYWSVNCHYLNRAFSWFPVTTKRYLGLESGNVVLSPVNQTIAVRILELFHSDANDFQLYLNANICGSIKASIMLDYVTGRHLHIACNMPLIWIKIKARCLS